MIAQPVDALDRGRRWVWRQAARTRAGRACARDRSTRVCALGLAHVAVALALSATAPGLLLLLGPLVLGVPHVVADLRYLVVRGPASLAASSIVAIAAPLAAMGGLGAMTIMGSAPAPALAVALGFAAIGAAVVLAPGGGRRRLAVAGAVALLAMPALRAPSTTMLALLLGHNLVALAIWCGWTRPTVRSAHRAAVVAAVAAGLALIAAGAFDRALGDGARLAWTDGLDPVLARRAVVAYAFLQAVHYAVWLRLIPATQAASPAPSTFRRSLAALRADLGAALPVLAVVAVAVPVLALIAGADRVRDGYLELALFHAWLELAIVAYVLVTRERLGEAARGP